MDKALSIRPDDNLLSKERTLKNQLGYIGGLLWRDRSGVIGMLIFLSVVFAALFAPFITKYDPLAVDFEHSKLPPAWQQGGNFEHLLGTDDLGRDMFSRIIYSARVSLFVSFIGALIASILGVGLGLIAGYVGGRMDAIIMAPVNLVLSLPYLLFVVFIATVLGRSLLNVILIFGITNSPIFARLTRGEVLRIRESAYVESAVSAGARFWRILLIHILPNLIGPLITLATFQVSAMIFYEAGLGFIGLSVPPSVPSWGNMLADGRSYLSSYPWLTTFPGLAIVYTSLGMNLLGDWLRDVFDPKLRRSRR
ncbi:MAG TPA: ABC transporter permease [Anaerolineales bacterium]|nr:ABC transporter permease [Anaerolineales bacterium]